MDKFWYPPEWQCPHGVDFDQFRCLPCDQKIDWKRVALGWALRVRADVAVVGKEPKHG